MGCALRAGQAHQKYFPCARSDACKQAAHPGALGHGAHALSASCPRAQGHLCSCRGRRARALCGRAPRRRRRGGAPSAAAPHAHRLACLSRDDARAVPERHHRVLHGRSDASRE
eukprot:Amastigsp_a342658_19.p6 type:complete len:114 gc:universal Amastigsp_a342658_19:362-703(+)